MKLARHFLNVNLAGGVIHTGIYVEGNRCVVQPFHNFRPERVPQWVKLLDRFCVGKWVDYTTKLNQPLKRIEILLNSVNENGRTNFQIGSQCLPTGRKVVGLVGG